MKSIYTVPALALVAASLTGIAHADISYAGGAKTDIPDLSHARSSNSRIGVASYDEHGRILIPRSAGFEQGETIYDSEGRVVGIKQATAPQSDGGITYNSEGGIVLPNQHFSAANAGNKGCGGSECVALPFHMGYVDKDDAGNERLNVITYNSDGGIVLPNSIAQQSNDDKKNGNPDEGGMVPMPFSRGSKIAVNQSQTTDDNTAASSSPSSTTGSSSSSSNASQDGQYKQGLGYFYDLEGHRGSCGKNAKNTDLVAALSASAMGTEQGSKNENCGRHLEVIGSNGQSVDVEVVDYCNTCGEGDLDLSPAAYERIAELNSFNTTIKWRFV